jgi:hypothetical protein
VTLGDIANGNHDRVASVFNSRTTDNAVSWLHRDGANHVVANVLGNFKSQHALAAAFFARVKGHVDVEGVVKRWHGLDWELDVNNRSGDASNAAHAGCGGLSSHDDSFS